jgi:hypothetical protein
LDPQHRHKLRIQAFTATATAYSMPHPYRRRGPLAIRTFINTARQRFVKIGAPAVGVIEHELDALVRSCAVSAIEGRTPRLRAGTPTPTTWCCRDLSDDARRTPRSG